MPFLRLNSGFRQQLLLTLGFAILFVFLLIKVDNAGDHGDPDDLTSSLNSLLRGFVRSSKLVRPQDLKITSNDYIHLALLAKGLRGDTLEAYKMRLNFRNCLRSLILRNMDTPVHLIVLTSEQDVQVIEDVFKDEHPPFRLKSKLGNGTEVDRYHLEFVDVSYVTREIVRPLATTMKKLFNNHGGEYFMTVNHNTDPNKTRSFIVQLAEKYNDDIFYISPFYWKIFPEIKKLIVVDADVQFKIDIADIHGTFSSFKDTEVVGIANDLAPHYFQMLATYRSENPNSTIGAPGRFQGLNVGVLLCDLAKMRSSREYQGALEESEVRRMAEKYHMTRTHLGAQDWFSLVSFEHSDLIHPLSCLYNRQLGTDYNQGPWEDIFPHFHNCPEEGPNGQEIYILHGNSDSAL